MILSSRWWLIVVSRALIRGMGTFILFYCCFPPMYQFLELVDVALSLANLLLFRLNAKMLLEIKTLLLLLKCKLSAA